MSLTPAVPPSGTLTFLFTDIEGSTALWEQQPDRMRTAVGRHDAALREAIAAENGFVFHTAGDAFCAAFATAPEALAAAVTAQRALQSGSDLLLRVRMGLHTGAAELRDGDYFGPPLNRVSRLMTAGHGGQILLSVACQELTRDALPSGVTLRDLGAHRLKDLARPEKVFQVVHPDLPADFPPLRSLDNPDQPNNLPQQMTSFIGRETEAAQIKALLETSRLLTLTGAGGAGKTRLALQTAADLLDGTGDGVWLVELAPLSDPEMVPQAVAEVLGVREEPGRPVARTLADWLKPRRLLLVLDNCEHLLEACAFLAGDLLRVCPAVSLLATSREALGVLGEQTYRVPSLSLPDPKQTYTAEALSQYEAVRLFIDRARLSQPSFAVTDQNAPAVTRICARLDGIPLAIELAAARVKSLSVEQIGARLDDCFRLLTGGSRTALPRQQTLKAAIDWSYDLLSDSEKTLLRRLSVFSGGWTLEAAESVCTDPSEIIRMSKVDADDVLDLLSSLIDKSLVVYEEDAQGRYRLLETVKQYGQHQLAESGEVEAVRRRHLDFFLTWAEEAEPEIIGPRQAEWLDRFELEHDNLRLALEWCLEEENGAEDALRLTAALGIFWRRRGHRSEGRQWLSRALEQAGGQAAGRLRARALFSAGVLTADQGDFELARPLYNQSLALSRQAGDVEGTASALAGLGQLAIFRRDHDLLQELYGESLALSQSLGRQNGMVEALMGLGTGAHLRGDHGSAQAIFGEGLALARQIENQNSVAFLLKYLGDIALDQGEYAQARILFEESLPVFRQQKNRNGISFVLLSLGQTAYYSGSRAEAQPLVEDSLLLLRQLGLRAFIPASLLFLGRVVSAQGSGTAARRLLTEGLTLAQDLGQRLNMVRGLEGFAGLAHDQNYWARAARLLGAAELLREPLGLPLDFGDRVEQDRRVASVREVLGEGAFAAAVAEGQAMSLETAAEYALAGGNG